MNVFRVCSLVLLSGLLVACSEPATDANSPETSDSNTTPVAQIAESQAVAPTDAPSCQYTLGFQAWEPYQYIAVGHEVSGLDIEIARAVMADMGCVLETRQSTWRDLLSLLRAGEIDFVMGASKTAAREEYALFSDPYRNEQFALFIRLRDSQQFHIESVADFIEKGNVLGVVNEYYYGDGISDALARGEENGHVRGAIMSELNIARLLDGEIDGFLEDELVATSMIRRKGLQLDIEQHELSLPSSAVYVMFSQAAVNADDVTAFNTSLAAIRANGTYAKILERYYSKANLPAMR